MSHLGREHKAGDRDQEVLDAIKRLSADGFSPSYDELAAAMGVKSKSGVHRRIQRLRDLGRVRVVPNRARTLEVIEPLDQEVRRLIAHHGRDAVRFAVIDALRLPGAAA